MKMKLTDDSPMPFGIHKDTPMKDVPADYLLWLHDEMKTNPRVQRYIDDNWDRLEEEVEE